MIFPHAADDGTQSHAYQGILRTTLLASLLLLSTACYSGCHNAREPDINRDQIVDWRDYWLVARSVGLSAEDPRHNPAADIDCDGDIDQADLAVVLDDFYQAYPTRTTGSIEIALPNMQGPKTLEELQLKPGDRKTLFLRHFFNARNHKPFTVQLTTELQPKSGVKIEQQAHDDLYHSDHRHRFKRFEKVRIEALQPGCYHLRFKATIIESGETFSNGLILSIRPDAAPDLAYPLFCGENYRLRKRIASRWASCWKVPVSTKSSEWTLSMRIPVNLLQSPNRSCSVAIPTSRV